MDWAPPGEQEAKDPLIDRLLWGWLLANIVATALFALWWFLQFDEEQGLRLFVSIPTMMLAASAPFVAAFTWHRGTRPDASFLQGRTGQVAKWHLLALGVLLMVMLPGLLTPK